MLYRYILNLKYSIKFNVLKLNIVLLSQKYEYNNMLVLTLLTYVCM
jgi:hypothetical protein